MSDLMPSYLQLLKETLQFLQAQPPGSFTIGTPSEARFFEPPARAEARPTPPPAPQFRAAPPPAKSVVIEKKEDVDFERAEPKVRQVADLPPKKTVPSLGSEEIKKTLQKIGPHIHVTDQILDDAEAKRVGSAWKEKIPDVDVVLLLLDPAQETVDFLKNLGKAIHTQLGRTKIMAGTRLEEEKRWDLFLEKNTFRLIIASHGMQKHLDLMRHYKALPAQSQAFLGKIPLVELAPAPVYLQSLQQKAILWKRLCQILKE